MQISGDVTVLAALAVGGGLYFFVQGFRDLKFKRIIQNIPTSKINTGAVGTNVEIKAHIIPEKDKLVNSPISGVPCVFYSIEIQKLKRSKNSTYWKTIDKFYSHKGFYVDDNSGANALVLVNEAKITHKGQQKIFRMRSNNFDEMPPNLRAALTLNKNKLKRFRLKGTSWLFSSDYRFQEWYFREGEEVYILGFAESGIKAPQKNKLKFKTFLKAKRMIQADAKLQNRFDTDHDGFLNPDELERGAKKIAEQLESKYSVKKVAKLSLKTKMVFKKKKPHPFYITNMKEKELVKSIGWKSSLKIWGGPALTIAGSIYLINTLVAFN